MRINATLIALTLMIPLVGLTFAATPAAATHCGSSVAMVCIEFGFPLPCLSVNCIVALVLDRAFCAADWDPSNEGINVLLACV